MKPNESKTNSNRSTRLGEDEDPLSTAKGIAVALVLSVLVYLACWLGYSLVF